MAKQAKRHMDLNIQGDLVTSNPLSFRNRLINGAMEIDQRNAGVAATPSTTPAYTLDRWSCVASAALSGTVQVGRGFYSGKNALYFLRSAGTFTGALKIIQPIESINCRDLAGKTATLSFTLLTGSAYLGGAMTASVITSTSADQTAQQFFSGGAAGQATAGSTAVTPSSSLTYQTFSLTVSIPANAQQIAVFFQNAGWSGTGSANDFIYITEVQLESGSSATPFERRPIGMELGLCQRYYEYGAYSWIGSFPGPNTVRFRVPFKVIKRVISTVNTITKGYSDGTLATVTPVVPFPDQDSIAIQFMSTGASGNSEMSGTWTASAEL